MNQRERREAWKSPKSLILYFLTCLFVAIALATVPAAIDHELDRQERLADTYRLAWLNSSPTPTAEEISNAN